MAIRLVPVGAIPQARLEYLAGHLVRLLRQGVIVHTEAFPPESVFDARRDQYRSDLLIGQLKRAFAYDTRVIGVTELDLFIPVLTFVFGEAELGGHAAVVSTFRLRNELYGLPADPDLMEARLVKEAMHELGHTFGLLHCQHTACVMQTSPYAELVDLKPADFCTECRLKYEAAGAVWPMLS